MAARYYRVTPVERCCCCKEAKSKGHGHLGRRTHVRLTPIYGASSQPQHEEEEEEEGTFHSDMTENVTCFGVEVPHVLRPQQHCAWHASQNASAFFR